MKKCISWIMIVLIAISLCSCSIGTESQLADEHATQSAELSISEYTYIQTDTDLMGELENVCFFSTVDNKVYFIANMPDQENRLWVTDSSFMKVSDIELTPVENSTLVNYCVNDDSVFALWVSTPEEKQYTLQRYTLDEKLQWSNTANELLPGVTNTAYITDITGSSDGCVLLAANKVCSVANDGAFLGETEVDMGVNILFSDKEGNPYIIKNAVDICSIEAGEIHEPVHSLEIGTQVFPGDSVYDLYIIDNSIVVGFSLASGEKIDLIDFTDTAVDISVSYIAKQADGNYMACGYDPIFETDRVVQLTNVATSSLPEPQTLCLAVPLPEYYASVSDVLDLPFLSLVEKYSVRNPGCTVLFQTYADSLELQRLLLSEQPPDIILFSADQMDADLPSEQTLGRNGYLVDLNDFLTGDADINADAFLNSYLDVMKDDAGHLYSLSSGFYIRTMYGLPEYVGESDGWTLEEFMDRIEAMPSEMKISTSSQKGFLENILTAAIDEFADYDLCTSNFTDGRFSRLLDLCGDYLNKADSSGGSVKGKDIMLEYSVVMKSLDSIPANNEVSFIGYPGAPGNGAMLATNDTLAICSYSKKQELAWNFFKMMFMHEYQINCLGPFYPVLKKPFNDTVDELVIENDQTKEWLLKLVSNTEYRVCLYDPIINIVLEEIDAYFIGDKLADEVTEIIENRVNIFLSEQK